MLILCSNGLTNEKLIEEASPYVACGGKAALVVTADNEYKEQNYHVPRCTSELESLGLTVELFDLDVSPAQDLLSYDAVEFIGGNPYYLLDSIRRHDAADILRDIAKNKLLIGWSAAVFVFGPSIGLVDKFSPEMNTPGITDLTGLRLTSVYVLPHYSKVSGKFEHFEEKCHEFEEENDCRVIRIDDSEGILIQDDEITSFIPKSTRNPFVPM